MTRRLLVALSGESLPARRVMEDAVIVAEELLPSAAAELDFARVRAIATDGGGWTSHTAIIARGMGIPAVVGLRDLYRRARTGDEIVVDARKGEVVLHLRGRPRGDTRASRTCLGGRARRCRRWQRRGGEPLLTRRREIVLRANVELPAEFEGVRR